MIVLCCSMGGWAKRSEGRPFSVFEKAKERNGGRIFLSPE